VARIIQGTRKALSPETLAKTKSCSSRPGRGSLVGGGLGRRLGSALAARHELSAEEQRREAQQRY